MKTISQQEFQKKYGEASKQFIPPATRPSIGEVIGRSFKAGVEQVKKGVAQTDPFNSKNSVRTLISGVGNIGSGAINAAMSPIAPITEPTIGRGLNYVGDKLGSIPAVQAFANSKAGEVTSGIAEDVVNYSNITGVVGGTMKVPTVASGVTSKVTGAADAVAGATGKVTTYAKQATRDVVPTTGRIINEQVAQALDLTPIDLKNIHKSTGHDVGTFLADNNLIGKNVDSTTSMLSDFYKQNYQAVRGEIAKVDSTYARSQVKGYYDGLKEVQRQIKDVPGLTKDSVEVTNLMNKAKLTLDDVQRAKELMDEHFNLYKVTGDVKEGAAKQGLTNIRKELRTFIEDQVKAKTGADIKAMNNNVSTARGILNAVDDRATRGLTRSHLSLGDLGLFGTGTLAAGPLVGAALVFGKKLLQSPSVRLRIAKYLDGLEDAKKTNIQAKLSAGEIPTELKQVVPKSWFAKVKEAMSDEGGFMKNPFTTEQVQDTFQRLQARKIQLLEKGYKETSPAVKNIIKSMKQLENE